MQRTTVRDINGILLLNKHKNISSNKALQQIKRLFLAKKAGHTGSLDPLATGILPICFGQATKFASYMLNDNKTYIATLQLGTTTTTLDAAGKVVQKFETKHINKPLVQRVLKKFIGTINQIPPMFSALKVGGTPLYKIARQGIEVTRKARKVTVFAIDIISFNNNELKIKVQASKGTYIRTLADDIGRALNSGAHIKELVRVGFADFHLDDCHTFASLKNNDAATNYAKLLKVEDVLTVLPAISISDIDFNAIKYGRKIKKNVNVPKNTNMVKMFVGNKFIGIGEFMDKYIQPKKLITA